MKTTQIKDSVLKHNSMKTNRFINALPLTFAVAALSVSPLLSADAPSSNSAPTKPADTRSEQKSHRGGHHGLSFLTAEEKTKLKAAHEAALKDNPELKSESDSMRAERKAASEKWKAHRERMKTAMLKADPSLKPTFDKLDEHRKEWKKSHEEQGEKGKLGTE
jgi:hypothetical protein